MSKPPLKRRILLFKSLISENGQKWVYYLFYAYHFPSKTCAFEVLTPSGFEWTKSTLIVHSAIQSYQCFLLVTGRIAPAFSLTKQYDPIKSESANADTKSPPKFKLYKFFFWRDSHVIHTLVLKKNAIGNY